MQNICITQFELMENAWWQNLEKLVETIITNLKHGTCTKKKTNLTAAETVSKLISPKSNVTRYKTLFVHKNFNQFVIFFLKIYLEIPSGKM